MKKVTPAELRQYVKKKGSGGSGDGIPEAPNTGKLYGRKSKNWFVVNELPENTRIIWDTDVDKPVFQRYTGDTWKTVDTFGSLETNKLISNKDFGGFRMRDNKGNEIHAIRKAIVSETEQGTSITAFNYQADDGHYLATSLAGLTQIKRSKFDQSITVREGTEVCDIDYFELAYIPKTKDMLCVSYTLDVRTPIDDMFYNMALYQYKNGVETLISDFNDDNEDQSLWWQNYRNPNYKISLKEGINTIELPIPIPCRIGQHFVFKIWFDKPITMVCKDLEPNMVISGNEIFFDKLLTHRSGTKQEMLEYEIDSPMTWQDIKDGRLYFNINSKEWKPLTDWNTVMNACSGDSLEVRHMIKEWSAIGVEEADLKILTPKVLEGMLPVVKIWESDKLTIKFSEAIQKDKYVDLVFEDSRLAGQRIDFMLEFAPTTADLFKSNPNTISYLNGRGESETIENFWPRYFGNTLDLFVTADVTDEGRFTIRIGEGNDLVKANVFLSTLNYTEPFKTEALIDKFGKVNTQMLSDEVVKTWDIHYLTTEGEGDKVLTDSGNYKSPYAIPVDTVKGQNINFSFRDGGMYYYLTDYEDTNKVSPDSSEPEFLPVVKNTLGYEKRFFYITFPKDIPDEHDCTISFLDNTLNYKDVNLYMSTVSTKEVKLNPDSWKMLNGYHDEFKYTYKSISSYSRGASAGFTFKNQDNTFTLVVGGGNELAGLTYECYIELNNPPLKVPLMQKKYLNPELLNPNDLTVKFDATASDFKTMFDFEGFYKCYGMEMSKPSPNSDFYANVNIFNEDNCSIEAYDIKDGKYYLLRKVDKVWGEWQSQGGGSSGWDKRLNLKTENIAITYEDTNPRPIQYKLDASKIRFNPYGATQSPTIVNGNAVFNLVNIDSDENKLVMYIPVDLSMWGAQTTLEMVFTAGAEPFALEPSSFILTSDDGQAIRMSYDSRSDETEGKIKCIFDPVNYKAIAMSVGYGNKWTTATASFSFSYTGVLPVDATDNMFIDNKLNKKFACNEFTGLTLDNGKGTPEIYYASDIGKTRILGGSSDRGSMMTFGSRHCDVKLRGYTEALVEVATDNYELKIHTMEEIEPVFNKMAGLVHSIDFKATMPDGDFTPFAMQAYSTESFDATIYIEDKETHSIVFPRTKLPFRTSPDRTTPNEPNPAFAMIPDLSDRFMVRPDRIYKLTIELEKENVIYGDSLPYLGMDISILDTQKIVGEDSFRYKANPVTDIRWVGARTGGDFIDIVNEKYLTDIWSPRSLKTIPDRDINGNMWIGIKQDTFNKNCNGTIVVPFTIYTIETGNFFELDGNGNKASYYTIKGKSGSEAHRYAVANGLPFISDGRLPDTTEPNMVLSTGKDGNPYWKSGTGTVYLSDTHRITIGNDGKFEFQIMMNGVWTVKGAIG